MHLHQMINHLVLARESPTSFHLAPMASIDRTPKTRHVVLGGVVSAQFGTATEGCAITRSDVADVFARPSHATHGRSDVFVVLSSGCCGSGREAWRVSVDDEVASWGEVGRLSFEALEFHGYIGREEVWPGIKLVSTKLSLE